MNKSIEEGYVNMGSGTYVVPCVYTYISNNDQYWNDL